MTRVIKTTATAGDVAVALCAKALADGDLVVLPTDTVYGVAAHPDRRDAVERVYAAKRRDPGNPIPLLASGVDVLARAGAALSAGERGLADAFWPGALTMVLALGDTPEGVRVPACDITRRVIAACGGLLRVTSANRSGLPPACTVDEALRDLGQHVAVALDDGPAGGGVASTVVRVVKGELKILRRGTLTVEELWAVMPRA